MSVRQFSARITENIIERGNNLSRIKNSAAFSALGIPRYVRRYASYAPHDLKIVVHDGPPASISALVDNSLAVISARSMLRPRVKKLHASSRLVDDSSVPTAKALRSRTQPKNSCTFSGDTRLGKRDLVVFNTSHSSVETTSRALLAFSLAWSIENAIEAWWSLVTPKSVIRSDRVTGASSGHYFHDGQKCPAGDVFFHPRVFKE